MSLTSAHRRCLAGLADLLIPCGNGFPCASEAGVAESGLDAVLKARPDLAEPLTKLLERAEGRVAADFLKEIEAKDPGAFGILAEVVPGAYFMNQAVRARLNYHGQKAHPFEPREDYLEDDLLKSVLERGPIYRPTP